MGGKRTSLMPWVGSPVGNRITAGLSGDNWSHGGATEDAPGGREVAGLLSNLFPALLVPPTG